jgi:hypothetical protein
VKHLMAGVLYIYGGWGTCFDFFANRLCNSHCIHKYTKIILFGGLGAGGVYKLDN